MTGQPPPPGLAPLAGLTVLELGDGVAGAAAADVLAALGAAVTTVAAPDSALRSLSPQFEGSSVLSAVLDSRKQVLPAMTADQVLAGIAAADVIVCDQVHRAAAGLPADPEGYLEFVAGHNRAAWVTVSAFGMNGLKAGLRGSELIIAAASGVLNSVRDPETGRRPVKLPGSQALLSAGAAAALAGLHALSERAVTGEPQHACISAQAAALMTGPVIQCAAPMLNTPGPGGANRFGAPAGLYECRDGAICIMAMEQHQWEGIVRALDNPEWARDFDRWEDRLDRADECNALLADAVRSWDRFELEGTLQAHGVPAGAVRGPRDLLASPQFATREALRPVDVAGYASRVVSAPFGIAAGPADDGEVQPAPTIRGLRVLEASHILAVPLAGALLGACGADVVKLEDPRRPDSYRTRGPYIDGHADKDWSAYFALMNHSKQSLDVDLSRPDVVEALLGAADVILENYGPSRARRYKIDSVQASRDHAGLLAISSSGYGHTGPWAPYRAYAYNLHASSGLLHLTRSRSGGHVDLDMAVADLMTGYALATIVAAWAVGGRQPGASADVAMSELVAARLGDFLAAAALGIDADPEPGSSRQAPYAPHGAYASGDDRWVAIAVLTDAQWLALKAQLGNPAALENTAWVTAAGRSAGQDELDTALGTELSRCPAEELAGKLQRHGVLASVVYSAAELVAEGGLLDPAYLPQVDHPLWHRRRLLGLPWTFAGRQPAVITPPPLLGSARTAAGSWAGELAEAVDGLESGAVA